MSDYESDSKGLCAKALEQHEKQHGGSRTGAAEAMKALSNAGFSVESEPAPPVEENPGSSSGSSGAVLARQVLPPSWPCKACKRHVSEGDPEDPGRPLQCGTRHGCIVCIDCAFVRRSCRPNVPTGRWVGDATTEGSDAQKELEYYQPRFSKSRHEEGRSRWHGDSYKKASGEPPKVASYNDKRGEVIVGDDEFGWQGVWEHAHYPAKPHEVNPPLNTRQIVDPESGTLRWAVIFQGSGKKAVKTIGAAGLRLERDETPEVGTEGAAEKIFGAHSVREGVGLAVSGMNAAASGTGPSQKPRASAFPPAPGPTNGLQGAPQHYPPPATGGGFPGFAAPPTVPARPVGGLPGFAAPRTLPTGGFSGFAAAAAAAAPPAMPAGGFPGFGAPPPTTAPVGFGGFGAPLPGVQNTGGLPAAAPGKDARSSLSESASGGGRKEVKKRSAEEAAMEAAILQAETKKAKAANEKFATVKTKEELWSQMVVHTTVMSAFEKPKKKLSKSSMDEEDEILQEQTNLGNALDDIARAVAVQNAYKSFEASSSVGTKGNKTGEKLITVVQDAQKWNLAIPDVVTCATTKHAAFQTCAKGAYTEMYPEVEQNTKTIAKELVMDLVHAVVAKHFSCALSAVTKDTLEDDATATFTEFYKVVEMNIAEDKKREALVAELGHTPAIVLPKMSKVPKIEVALDALKKTPLGPLMKLPKGPAGRLIVTAANKEIVSAEKDVANGESLRKMVGQLAKCVDELFEQFRRQGGLTAGEQLAAAAQTLVDILNDVSRKFVHSHLSDFKDF